MTKWIVWACIASSALSFLVFLGAVTRQIWLIPPETRKPVDAFVVDPEDLTRLLTAGQAFVDAMAKAAPHVLALVASIIFMWLAIRTDAQSRAPGPPPSDQGKPAP
jgi:hypothetical protein